MDLPTKDTNINPNPQPQPQPLTKSNFIKLTAKRVDKRDGTTGYVLSSQDVGKKCSYSKGDYSLNFTMKKKEKFIPNQPKNESGYEFESWLFGEIEGAQAKERAFLELGTIFAHSKNDDDFVHLYMNINDEHMLLNEEEYLRLS